MREKYVAMKTREFAQINPEMDQEDGGELSRPLSASERARQRRSKLKPPRPKITKGVKLISLSLEQGLLTRVDKAAKKLRLSRAQLVSKGLEFLLARFNK
jgi:hypothetical protein